MFERFTDRARRVVVYAKEEALLLNHNYIGTEHLVLGFLREGEGIAARVLTALDIDLENTRSAVEDMLGRGGSQLSGHIPFTPRAKQVLEYSLREALQLGHNYIGTEHLLLGLLREGEGVGCQLIIRADIPLDVVRQSVIQVLVGGKPITREDMKTAPARAETREGLARILELHEAGQVTHQRFRTAIALLNPESCSDEQFARVLEVLDLKAEEEGG
jgi:ATP-dependent Clp protease ATP-binding subunit ClpC